jgi:hypothetical protein
MAGQSNALNTPSLVVVDEAVIPDGFWEPQAPRLNRQTLLAELKQGESIAGVALCNPQPCLKREGKVMGFSGAAAGMVPCLVSPIAASKCSHRKPQSLPAPIGIH